MLSLVIVWLIRLPFGPTNKGTILPPETYIIRDHSLIKDFPYHATFKEKGAKLACADKLGVFLSLTLCNKARFDPLQRVKYDGLGKKLKQEKNV